MPNVGDSPFRGIPVLAAQLNRKNHHHADSIREEVQSLVCVAFNFFCKLFRQESVFYVQTAPPLSACGGAPQATEIQSETRLVQTNV